MLEANPNAKPSWKPSSNPKRRRAKTENCASTSSKTKTSGSNKCRCRRHRRRRKRNPGSRGRFWKTTTTNRPPVLWLTRSNPEMEREARLRRQWRMSRRMVSLETLPLQLLLQSQYRSLVETAEAESEKTGLLPVHRKLWRRTKNAIAIARKQLADRPLLWLCRQPCLQPLRTAMVQCKRRLAVQLLVCLVRICRQLRSSPGIPTR